MIFRPHGYTVLGKYTKKKNEKYKEKKNCEHSLNFPLYYWRFVPFMMFCISRLNLEQQSLLPGF